MRDPRERLLDMLEAISRIERYATQGRQAFEADELIQTYIVHHLQILGEAVLKLPQDIRAQHPEVPWAEIRGMRHVLVHDYFLIDLDIVWAVVEKDLPDLKHKIETILEELASGG